MSKQIDLMADDFYSKMLKIYRNTNALNDKDKAVDYFRNRPFDAMGSLLLYKNMIKYDNSQTNGFMRKLRELRNSGKYNFENLEDKIALELYGEFCIVFENTNDNISMINDASWIQGQRVKIPIWQKNLLDDNKQISCIKMASELTLPEPVVRLGLMILMEETTISGLDVYA